MIGLIRLKVQQRKNYVQKSVNFHKSNFTLFTFLYTVVTECGRYHAASTPHFIFLLCRRSESFLCGSSVDEHYNLPNSTLITCEC